MVAAAFQCPDEPLRSAWVVELLALADPFWACRTGLIRTGRSNFGLSNPAPSWRGRSKLAFSARTAQAVRASNFPAPFIVAAGLTPGIGPLLRDAGRRTAAVTTLTRWTRKTFPLKRLAAPEECFPVPPGLPDPRLAAEFNGVAHRGRRPPTTSAKVPSWASAARSRRSYATQAARCWTPRIVTSFTSASPIRSARPGRTGDRPFAAHRNLAGNVDPFGLAVPASSRSRRRTSLAFGVRSFPSAASLSFANSSGSSSRSLPGSTSRISGPYPTRRIFSTKCPMEEHSGSAIAAFDQYHFIPGIVALAEPADARRRCAASVRPRLAALDHYATPKPIQLFFCGLASHFHEVGFLRHPALVSLFANSPSLVTSNRPSLI